MSATSFALLERVYRKTTFDGSPAVQPRKTLLFTGLTPSSWRRLMGAGRAAANARNHSGQ
jgi:hypothetical protein